MTNYCL